MSSKNGNKTYVHLLFSLFKFKNSTKQPALQNVTNFKAQIAFIFSAVFLHVNVLC